MFFKNLRADINAAKKFDPAARNKFEILLTYSGVHALSWHRVARFFYRIKLKLIHINYLYKTNSYRQLRKQSQVEI